MIVKWDGREEDFKVEKLARTLTRMGAPQSVAEEIAKDIEEQISEGMTTEEIYEMAIQELESHKEIVEFRRDLKDGLSRLGGGHIFEKYIRLVLREHGYKVKGNCVIQGACVTHEIDGVAERDGETIYLEAKYHSVQERYIPFEVTLAAKAKWDDIRAGHAQGLNEYSFDRVLIVTNTRLTKHARQYAECVGISYFGWNWPKGQGLDRLIEEKKLYPCTILRSISDRERDKLLAHGIITLKQLVESKSSNVGLSKRRIAEIIDEAHRVFTCCQAES